jgi:hypothetical protein
MYTPKSEVSSILVNDTSTCSLKLVNLQFSAGDFGVIALSADS